MSEHPTFVERTLRGEVYDPANAIDDAIDEWHTAGSGVPLRDWLGFSAEEYALFVEEPRHLSTILKARRYKLDVTEVARARDAGDVALAARGLESEEMQEVVAWLKRTGRL